MADYSSERKVNPYGLNPPGLAVTILCFLVVVTVLSIIGARDQNTLMAGMESGTAVLDSAGTPSETVPGEEPAAIAGDAKPAGDGEAVPEEKAAGEQEDESAAPAAAKSPEKEKPKTAPAAATAKKSSKTITRENAAGRQMTSVDIAPAAQGPPSRLVSPEGLQHRIETGLPVNVDKVEPEKVEEGVPIDWYSVQVGFTDSKVRADVLKDVLLQQGYDQAKTVNAGNGTYYVALGDYRFRYQAEEAAEIVKEKTNLTARIHEKTVAR